MTEFELSGIVTPYTGAGRKLGYPTANIETVEDTEEGLFVGYVDLAGKDMPALIFIGAPITLGDHVKRAEAHILDFEDRDLYGEKVVFRVKEKLRNNVMFNSEEELVEQMRIDEVHARKYFREHGKD